MQDTCGYGCDKNRYGYRFARTLLMLKFVGIKVVLKQTK